jgi:hypothetical protein
MNIFTRLILILALTTSLVGQQPARGTADQPVLSKDSTESRGPATTPNFFKLAFVIYELEDGKRINQRDYMMVGKANNQGSSVHIGTRVPVNMEEGKKVTYIDAGLNIRCNLQEQADHRLQADCDIEISSFIRPEQLAGSGNDASLAPVLRNSRTSSWALLTPGKSTLLATVDDISSTKRMQVELTATKVD